MLSGGRRQRVAVLAGALAGAVAAIRVGRSSLAVVARGATPARRSRPAGLAATLSLPAWLVLGVKDRSPGGDGPC